MTSQPQLHRRSAEIQEFGTVVRTGETQVRFLAEHLVAVPSGQS